MYLSFWSMVFQTYAVPALDDLGTRDAEPELEAATRQPLEGQRGHRCRRRSPSGDLGDGGAEADRLGGGGNEGQRGERILAPASEDQIES